MQVRFSRSSIVPERFDVIVVGAGLAGLSAAYTMVKQGMTVAVIERGDHPGSKNVMGGILSSQSIADMFPEFWHDAPLQRPIVELHRWLFSGESLVKVGHRDAAWAREPYHGFSVLRGPFDAWLGQQVAAAGALIVPGTTVLDLLRDGRGQVIGARVNRPEGDLLADLVILADGANSLLGERMGLHPRRRLDGLALAVKEVLVPPGGVEERARGIEQRFGLLPGQGVAIEMFGSLTKSMVGKAFLYTNKDTIAFSLSVLLSDQVAQQESAYALLQAAKAHPAISPLLADCTPGEYSAHLLPDGDGAEALWPLYGPGVLVAGDAAGLCNSMQRDSAHLAILSGKLAGETALQAHKKGDFSRQTLVAYADRWRQTGAYKELRKYRKLSRYLQQRRQFFTRYPEALNALATEFFAGESTAKRDGLGKVWKAAGGKIRFALAMKGLFKVMK
jgi:electron transfer flavoprotein-quinone oxidoreductase